MSARRAHMFSAVLETLDFLKCNAHRVGLIQINTKLRGHLRPSVDSVCRWGWS